VAAPRPYAPPPRPVRTGSEGARARQVLLSLVPFVSFGFLSFVPFLVLAMIRQRRQDWLTFVAYVAVVIGIVVAVAAARRGTQADLAGGLIILVMAIGTTHSLVALRPSAVGNLTAQPPATQFRQDAVVEAAKARIHQRAEARKLVTENATLTRDLRIGRPDLPRNYDDGGLVDVNHVGANILVRYLGLAPKDADAIVTARAQLGRFTSCNEVTTYANLQPSCLDNVTDLIIFC
jgi:DNA uptake protein ComE-like DNA-binding protein